jgi:hypothetical protein
MSETHLHPSTEQITALQGMDLEGPVVMINLLRFNPDGGAAAYAEYGAAATPFLSNAQATIRFMGTVHTTIIGPTDEAWDEAILVEYPTLAAFFEMTGHPDYPSQLRANALRDSRLYCSQDTSH